MSHSKSQINITLTPNQEAYVREHYHQMRRSEICNNLKITTGVLNENIRLMNIPNKKVYRTSRPVDVEVAGFFHVDSYLKELSTI